MAGIRWSGAGFLGRFRGVGLSRALGRCRSDVAGFLSSQTNRIVGDEQGLRRGRRGSWWCSWMRSSGVERRGTVGDDRFFAVGRGFQPRLRLGEGRSELNPRVVGKRSGRES